MSNSEIRESIRSFIASEILEGEAMEFDDKTSLMDVGVVDSMSAVMLVSHIKKTLGVEIPPQEMVKKNFDCVESIVALVERLRGPAS